MICLTLQVVSPDTILRIGLLQDSIPGCEVKVSEVVKFVVNSLCAVTIA